MFNPGLDLQANAIIIFIWLLLIVVTHSHKFNYTYFSTESPRHCKYPQEIEE